MHNTINWEYLRTRLIWLHAKKYFIESGRFHLRRNELRTTNEMNKKKMMKCQIECESLLWFIYYLFLKLKDSEPRTHSYANQFACTYLKLIGHFPLSTYSFMYILNYTLLYYTIILKRKKKKNLNFSYFYTIY